MYSNIYVLFSPRGDQQMVPLVVPRDCLGQRLLLTLLMADLDCPGMPPVELQRVHTVAREGRVLNWGVPRPCTDLVSWVSISSLPRSRRV